MRIFVLLNKREYHRNLSKSSISMQHLDLVGSSSVRSGFMVSYHVYLVNKFDFEDPLIHRKHR